MIGLKEITKWDQVESKVHNHTYILNDAGACVAYIIADTGEYVEFTKPLNAFSKSRRKFIEVELDNMGPF